jgi:hypothetical protein
MLLFLRRGAVLPSIPKVRKVGGREFIQVNKRFFLGPFQKLAFTESFQLSSGICSKTSRARRLTIRPFS